MHLDIMIALYCSLSCHMGPLYKHYCGVTVYTSGSFIILGRICIMPYGYFCFVFLYTFLFVYSFCFKDVVCFASDFYCISLFCFVTIEFTTLCRTCTSIFLDLIIWIRVVYPPETFCFLNILQPKTLYFWFLGRSYIIFIILEVYFS